MLDIVREKHALFQLIVGTLFTFKTELYGQLWNVNNESSSLIYMCYVLIILDIHQSLSYFI